MDVSAAHPEVVQRLRVTAEAFENELAAHSRPIGRLEGEDRGQARSEGPEEQEGESQLA